MDTLAGILVLLIIVLFLMIEIPNAIDSMWRNFLHTPLLNKLLIILLAIAVITFIIWLIFRSKPIRGLKHGPRFTTRAKSQDGIVVGSYDTDVLPKHVRQYVPYSTAPVIIPYNLLSRGVTVLGSMGCGKSRLMRSIHDKIRDRYPDIPILINDPKGEWLRTYYNPETDLIFAPNDKRSCGWKIWEDFKLRPELKQSMLSTAITAHSSPTNNERFWTDAAEMLLKDVTTDTTPEQARDLLLNKKESKSQDKTFLSIYSTALIGFRDIIATELGSRRSDRSFTIKQLLDWKGRIFLLNSPVCAEEQRGPLTLMLSAFLMETLLRPDVPEGELTAAAIIDEALNFNLPPDVERAIFTQSRSKGLAIIAGAQRLPNIRHGERGEWSVQAGHLFGMRTGDLDTRQALSERLGNIIYEEEQNSTTDSHGHTSTTKTITRIDHHAVAPADFGALKNREFVLFHEHGIAVGTTADVPGEQQDINVFSYDPRDDVHDFMRILL